MLGNDHGRTGGQAHEKAHQKVDQVSCGSAYGRQSFLSNEFSHDHGIRRVVKLLEKGSKQDGEEEDQKLLPDHAFRDPIILYGLIFLSLHQFHLLFEKNVFYKSSFLSSSPLFEDKYAGGRSRIVLQPVMPSCFMRYAALAQATITEEVNSGLESSFRLYSIT